MAGSRTSTRRGCATYGPLARAGAVRWLGAGASPRGRPPAASSSSSSGARSASRSRRLYRRRRSDGVYRYVVDRAVPLHDLGEEFTGFIGHCVDIHDYHQPRSPGPRVRRVPLPGRPDPSHDLHHHAGGPERLQQPVRRRLHRRRPRAPHRRALGRGGAPRRARRAVRAVEHVHDHRRVVRDALPLPAGGRRPVPLVPGARGPAARPRRPDPEVVWPQHRCPRSEDVRARAHRAARARAEGARRRGDRQSPEGRVPGHAVARAARRRSARSSAGSSSCGTRP